MSIRTLSKISLVLAVSLVLSACGGSSSDDDEAGSESVAGSDDGSVDGNGDEADGAPSASDILTDGASQPGDPGDTNAVENPAEDATDAPVIPASDESNVAIADDTGTSEDNEQADSPSETATDLFASIPEDCGIRTLPNGGQFCISASEGGRVFSLSESGEINYSAVLPADTNLAASRLISGSNLYVLNPMSSNTSSWVVTAIDASGNVQYTSPVGDNIATIETGFSIPPFLFLHVVSPSGDSRIIQIDELGGGVGATLDLAGQNIERVGSESFDGATFVSILADGETTFRESERLEPHVRGFTLSPETFMSEFANLMNIARANYLGQFIDVLNQTNSFAATATAGSTLPCAVSGSLDVLPESTFIFVNDVTRAYAYNDCVLNDRLINGNVIFNSQTTVEGDTTFTTETLDFDEVSISRFQDGLEQLEDDSFEVSATLNNMIRLRGGDVATEIARDLTTSVESFRQSSAGIEQVSISDASHEFRSNQFLQQSVPASADTRESGNMVLERGTSPTITLNITAPLFYEANGAEAQGQEIATAPLAGTVRISATDGSMLDVNASLSGVNMQNYLLIQAGVQTSIDGIWTVSPISIVPSLVQ